VALIRAANPTLSPAQVREIVRTTAVKIGTVEENAQNQYGAGLINAEAGVKAAIN